MDSLTLAAVDPLTLAAAALSLLAGALPTLLRDLVSRFTWLAPVQEALERIGVVEVPRAPEGNFSERIQRLTASLTEASTDFEGLLHEMEEVATRREAAVSELEAKLTELSRREEELQTRINTLSQTHPRAAQEFIALLEKEQAKGEKRSARRDYALFAAGVVVTILLTFLFNAIGLGS